MKTAQAKKQVQQHIDQIYPFALPVDQKIPDQWIVDSGKFVAAIFEAGYGYVIFADTQNISEFNEIPEMDITSKDALYDAIIEHYGEEYAVSVSNKIYE